MRLDLNHYRVNIPTVKSWIISRPETNPEDMIGEMSVATNVPIIAICYYVGEIVGFTPELEARIERLKTFYGVKEIVGQIIVDKEVKR